MTFQIGYTFGVHLGKVSRLDGKLIATKGTVADEFKSARFSLPIRAMSTGDITRDCHMVEALGLDYAGGRSRFPREHVCDLNNQVPASGPDSVAFPTIEFELKDFKLATGDQFPQHLEPGKTYALLVQGAWTIHGQVQDQVTRQKFVPLQIQVIDDAGKTLRVTGRFEIVLADHGIIVKPGGPGGVVKVKDSAFVNLDLLMVARAR